MSKSLQNYKFGWLFLCLILSPIFVWTQDLGSSTNILKNSSAAKSTAAKKAPSKKKSSKGKSTVARKKKSTSGAKPAGQASTAASSKKQPPPVKVVDSQKTNNSLAGNGQKTAGEFNESFEKAIDEGNNERNVRNYSRAEESYRRAQSLLPGDPRAIYGLGNLFSDQQRWEEAEKAYRGALKLDPQNPEASVALSFVLTQPVLGTNLIDRYSEAENLARRAIAWNAKNAVAHDQLGVALELQGNISDDTKKQYQTAIDLDPTFALAYAHLGRLLRRQGLIADSNQAYLNSIQFAVDIPTMILVADVMQSQQRYLDSEQLLRRALREDPKNPTGLYLLGRALTTRGNYEEAEMVLKKSTEISPNSFVSYTLLGSLFTRQGKFVIAEEFLIEALRVVSPNEQRRLAIDFETVGDGYMGAGKNVDAVRVYQRAITLDTSRTDLKNKLNNARIGNIKQ